MDNKKKNIYDSQIYSDLRRVQEECIDLTKTIAKYTQIWALGGSPSEVKQEVLWELIEKLATTEFHIEHAANQMHLGPNIKNRKDELLKAVSENRELN